MSSAQPDPITWEYYDYDNAQYRRPGPRGPVTDVLARGKWVPFTGHDRTAPYTYGDRINDPLSKCAHVVPSPDRTKPPLLTDDAAPDPAAWLPQAHFGYVGAPLPDHRNYDPGDDDEDPDAPTPPDVIWMLGFDPAKGG